MDEKKDGAVAKYESAPDVESSDRSSKVEFTAGHGKLVRQLKNRHIAMIRYVIDANY